MTANRILGSVRGIPEETLQQIDILHETIDAFMRKAVSSNHTDEYVKRVLSVYEETLQTLWGFPVDESRHRYFKTYLFKKTWVGRKFRCTTTGKEFIVPYDIYETMFISIGEGFLDLGRHPYYYRMSGIKEIF